MTHFFQSLAKEQFVIKGENFSVYFGQNVSTASCELNKGHHDQFQHCWSVGGGSIAQNAYNCQIMSDGVETCVIHGMVNGGNVLHYSRASTWGMVCICIASSGQQVGYTRNCWKGGSSKEVYDCRGLKEGGGEKFLGIHRLDCLLYKSPLDTVFIFSIKFQDQTLYEIGRQMTVLCGLQSRMANSIVLTGYVYDSKLQGYCNKSRDREAADKAPTCWAHSFCIKGTWSWKCGR